MCMFVHIHTCMGGDLGGTGGTVPKNFEVGGRPMHPSPNIWRSSVIGSVAKYEQTKKGVKEEIFFGNIRFS